MKGFIVSPSGHGDEEIHSVSQWAWGRRDSECLPVGMGTMMKGFRMSPSRHGDEGIHSVSQWAWGRR